MAENPLNDNQEEKVVEEVDALEQVGSEEDNSGASKRVEKESEGTKDSVSEALDEDSPQFKRAFEALTNGKTLDEKGEQMYKDLLNDASLEELEEYLSVCDDKDFLFIQNLLLNYDDFFDGKVIKLEAFLRYFNDLFSNVKFKEALNSAIERIKGEVVSKDPGLFGVFFTIVKVLKSEVFDSSDEEVDLDEITNEAGAHFRKIVDGLDFFSEIEDPMIFEILSEIDLEHFDLGEATEIMVEVEKERDFCEKDPDLVRLFMKIGGMFDGFVDAFKRLVQERTFFETIRDSNPELYQKFVEFSVGYKGGIKGVSVFLDNKELFIQNEKIDEDIFRLFLENYEKNYHRSKGANMLGEAKDLYFKDGVVDREWFDLFYEVSKKSEENLEELLSIRDVYEGNLEMLKAIVGLDMGYCWRESLKPLFTAKNIYGDDPEKLKLIARVWHIEETSFRNTGVFQRFIDEADVYKDDLGLFKRLVDLLYKEGENKVFRLFENKEVLEMEDELLDSFLEKINEERAYEEENSKYEEAIKLLKDLKDEMGDEFFKVLLDLDPEEDRDLRGFSSNYLCYLKENDWKIKDMAKFASGDVEVFKVLLTALEIIHINFLEELEKIKGVFESDSEVLSYCVKILSKIDRWSVEECIAGINELDEYFSDKQKMKAILKEVSELEDLKYFRYEAKFGEFFKINVDSNMSLARFKIYAKAIIKFGYDVISVWGFLSEFESLYGDDDQKMAKMAGYLSKNRGKYSLKTVEKIRGKMEEFNDFIKDDENKFDAFVTIASKNFIDIENFHEENKTNLDRFFNLREVYGDDPKLIKIFSKALAYWRYENTKRLVDLYQTNTHRFEKYVELQEREGDDSYYEITAFREAEEKYASDDRIFDDIWKVFVNVGRRGCVDFAGNLDYLKENKKYYDLYLKTMLELGRQPCEVLLQIISDFNEQGDFFDVALDTLQNLDYSLVSLLITAKGFYGNDFEKFVKMKELFEGFYSNNLKEFRQVITSFQVNILQKCNDDIEMLEVLVEVTKAHSTDFASGLFKFEEMFKGDVEKMKKVAEALRSVRSWSFDSLVQYKECYGDSVEILAYFGDLVSKAEEKKIKLLKNVSEVYKGDYEKFQSVLLIVDKGEVEDEKLMKYCVDILEKEGEEGVQAYLDELKERTPELKRRMISLEPDMEFRDSPEYLYVLRRVFGRDNMNTKLEKNVQVDDALEHLEKYSFPGGRQRDVFITESQGYKFKNEKNGDNVDLFKEYLWRVQRLVQELQKFCGNNEAQKKYFEEKVQEFFDRTEMKEMLEAEDLSVIEKMVIVMLDQNFKKQNQKKILDLLVLYHFIYEVDFQQFVNNSAERVKAGYDELTQRYQQWIELQGLYGENLKHTLDHEILKGVTAESFSEIGEVYVEEMLRRDSELLPKKIEKQLQNLVQRVPEDRVEGVIRSNMIRVFTKALDPGTQKELRGKIDEIVAEFFQDIDGRPTFEDLIPMMQKIKKLYFKAKYDPTNQINELAKADLNRVTQEVHKFEEDLDYVDPEGKWIHGFFTKTKETASARMRAGLCIGEDPKMYQNSDYFELVLKDAETGECVGLIMFLNIEVEEENGEKKKYLFFGPNPTQDILDEFDEKKVFNYLKRVAIDFAKANGYDGITIPNEHDKRPKNKATILGACTNRGGQFKEMLARMRLKDQNGYKNVEYNKYVPLSEGRYNYGYLSGTLIWERNPN